MDILVEKVRSANEVPLLGVREIAVLCMVIGTEPISIDGEMIKKFNLKHYPYNYGERMKLIQKLFPETKDTLHKRILLTISASGHRMDEIDAEYKCIIPQDIDSFLTQL